MTTPSQIIALLNSLSLGDLDAIRGRIDEARLACEGLGRGELATMLDDARRALVAGDLKTYRKRVETAVARLGHLR